MADILPNAPAPGFIWGAGGAQMTPEQIAAERKVAQSMIQSGIDYSPVQAWTQGASRVAQALLGAYDYRRAGEIEKANADADKNWLATLGGAPAAATAPAVVAPASAPPSPAPVVLGEGGKPAVADAQGVYGADAVMMPQGGGAPDYGRAIAGLETGGRANPYSVIGPDNGKGQRPIGKYQVMDFNVGPWTKEVLGQPMTPQQFAASPDAQEAVFKSKFGQYVQQTGNPQDAASMWFTGKPLAQTSGVPDVLGTTPQSYVQKFTKALGPAAAPTAAAADPAALPPNSTPATAIPPGYVIPGQPAPTAAPGVSAVSSALGGVSPALLAKMNDPYASEGVKKVAAMLVQHQLGQKATYQTLPDGTILQMDPNGVNAPKPVYQAPTKPKFTQIGEGMAGDKTFGYVDEATRKTYDAAGNQIGGPGAPNATGPGESMLAKGVASEDQTLSGEDYLKQYSPAVQSAVRNYVDGKTLPTGNPRKGYVQKIKEIAQKYGEDIGTPADDTTFAARRTMRSQLSSAAPSSLGGQINIGNTAIGHLADLSERATELGNYSGFGLAPLGHAINTVRGLSTDQAAKVQAMRDAAQHYGQEITKFYAGSPGGEAERNRFMTAMSAANTPAELAAVIQQEAELIQSRVGAIGDQIQGTLGAGGAAQYAVIRPASKVAIGKIAENVERLRGNAPAKAAAPASSGTIPDGWSVQVR